MNRHRTTGGPVGRHTPPHRAVARHHLLLWVAAVALLAAVGSAGALWLQGYRLYVVHTGSMTPTLRPGDLVIDRPAHGSLRVGDIITFRHSDLASDVVTHRITAITPEGIHTKGDANRSPDAWTIRFDQVQGSVRYRLAGFGYVAVYLKQASGVGSLVTTALAVVLLWGLFFPPDRASVPAEATPVA